MGLKITQEFTSGHCGGRRGCFCGIFSAQCSQEAAVSPPGDFTITYNLGSTKTNVCL